MIHYDMFGRAYPYPPDYIFYVFDNKFDMFFDWDLWWGDVFAPELAFARVVTEWDEKWGDDELFLDLTKLRPEDIRIEWEPIESVATEQSKIFIDDPTDEEIRAGKRRMAEAFPYHHPIIEIYGDHAFDYPQWLLNFLYYNPDIADKLYSSWIEEWDQQEADEMWAFLGYHEGTVPSSQEAAFDKRFDEVWDAMGESVKSQMPKIKNTVASIGMDVCEDMGTTPKELLLTAMDKVLSKASRMIPFKGFAKKLLSPKPPSKAEVKGLPWRKKR